MISDHHITHMVTIRRFYDTNVSVFFSQGAKCPRSEMKCETSKAGLVSKLASFPVTGPVILTKEQKQVLETVKSGRNLFFTGSAGTGKSFLMKRIIGK